MMAARARLGRRLGVALLASGCVWLALLGVDWVEGGRIQARARAAATAALAEEARNFAQMTLRLLTRIDMLQEMGASLTQSAGRGTELPAIRGFVARANDLSDVIVQVAGTDARGEVLWRADASLAGRLDAPGAAVMGAIVTGRREVAVGRPVMAPAARSLAARVVPFARAVREEGRLVGVVVVWIDPDLAARRFRSRGGAVTGPAVTLARRDGLPLGSSGALEGRPEVEPAWLEGVMEGGVTVRPVAAPGGERMAALAAIPGGTVVVMADRAAARMADGAGEALDALRFRLLLAGGAALAVAAQLVLFLHLRDMRRAARRAEAAAQASRAELDALAHADRLALLGEIAPSMAHELNQPLAAIALRAEALAQRVRPESDAHALVHEYVEGIITLTQRASRVIEDVRALARKDAGPSGAFDVGRSVWAALTVIEGRIRQSRVAVEFDPPAAPLMARGKELHFEQAIINLVANALDAYEVGDGGAVREVTVTARAAEGAVIVEVADRAGGVPEAIRPMIFKPFYTTKPAGRGTGLGLSLVERMITAMEGTIGCANRDGGAVFTIRLPLVGEEGGA